ncbi:MAG: tetraacyldisaccharide 4'-kinase [Bacteroidota bacterium]|nr:tetraacyldisaccharide 4'-kinase [Bacteroidota bacterium]
MKTVRKILLFPFSLLYALWIFLRNFLFDIDFLRSESFDIPVIGIGNLSLGGTGKTPLVEYLTKLLLAKNYKVALLSRGYKRKTKGFVLAKNNSTAIEIGDEPFQIKNKFQELVVAVCEKRVEGIKKLLQINPQLDVIILDDSFQHRYVKPGMNILLTEFYAPYFNDMIFPSGNLRDQKCSSKSADIILITKTKTDITAKEKNDFLLKLKPKNYQETFFSNIHYQELINFNNKLKLQLSSLNKYSVLLFSAIANYKVLLEFISERAKNIDFINFADHHNFTKKDINKIKKAFELLADENKILLTTEKDISRIRNSEKENLFKSLPLYFIPIDIIIDDSNTFNNKILKYVEENK